MAGFEGIFGGGGGGGGDCMLIVSMQRSCWRCLLVSFLLVSMIIITVDEMWGGI